MTVGALVREGLKARGWTMTRLAEEMGVGTNHVSQVISGRTLLSFNAVLRWSDLLGIDPQALLMARMAQTPWMRLPVPSDYESRREIAAMVIDWFNRLVQS